MKRRAFLGAALSAGVALGCNHRPDQTKSQKRRIVSLSPAVTETLFAIGAGPELVGVSDYCNYPDAAKQLPRTGTALTPNYEAIVRLSPTLILVDGAFSVPKRQLEALGKTRFLPWLSLSDIVASTRLLGVLTERNPAAEALATQIWEGLLRPAPATAPRVLAVLGESTGKLSEIYFIKQNSIHGDALRAAGARNAIEDAVTGVPRISIEQLLRIDPDLILVLVAPTPSGPVEADVLHDYRALTPLAAVKQGRLAMLKSDAAFANGPRILTLRDQLHAEIARYFPGT